MTAPRPDAASARGAQTRQRIVDAALTLFLEQGYDGTTMRAIAKAAGVSVGNAYYYFPSKEHLIQGFYDQMQAEHELAARPVFARETDFEARLLGLLRARVDTMLPYREFAATFFRNASDPTSPLSPFSSDSSPAREAATALYAEALHGSTAKVPEALTDDLPDLLWLYSMGIVLFWVYDSSPGCKRTYLLVDRTVPLVVKLVGMARYRLLRSAVEDVRTLLRDLRTP